MPSLGRMFSYISGEMPEEHSTFYTERIPFLHVCGLDDEGRPCGSILAENDGRRGFIVHHPRYNTLSEIEAKPWEGEPFLKNVEKYDREKDSMLVEVSTRRRNKFPGNITGLEKEDIMHLELVVSEALRYVFNRSGSILIFLKADASRSECPKYITLRELTPHPTTSPVVIENKPHLGVGEQLSSDTIAFILESDTVWLGTLHRESFVY